MSLYFGPDRPRELPGPAKSHHRHSRRLCAGRGVYDWLKCSIISGRIWSGGGQQCHRDQRIRGQRTNTAESLRPVNDSTQSVHKLGTSRPVVPRQIDDVTNVDPVPKGRLQQRYYKRRTVKSLQRNCFVIRSTLSMYNTRQFIVSCKVFCLYYKGFASYYKRN